MLFYLYKALPVCMLDIETINNFLLKRFQLFTTPATLQHDTEDSGYFDEISHLFMCIIVISCPQFKNSFVQGELKLFKEKLKFQKSVDIKRELSEVLNFLNLIVQSENFNTIKVRCSNQFYLVKNIIEAILSKTSHCFNKSHKVNCKKYKLTLPFTSVIKLVSKREVEVKNGIVSLYCGHWNEILEVIFEFLLEIKILLIEYSEDLKNIYESENDQVRQIIKQFSNTLNGFWGKEENTIEANDINEKSRYFPPCMANLHQILRQTHRLSYESRYQYSLFLKDIGLSLEDNILFWESEYKKPNAGSSCTHRWEENDKRYKYQLQHMYGYIGSYSPKTSHSCGKFIENLQSKMDGGCPFQHLTSEQLENALPQSFMSLPDVEDIFMYKNNGFPQKACAVYLTCMKKVLAKNRDAFEYEDFFNKCFYIVSPRQFYNIANKL